jgi:hypothetical protein
METCCADPANRRPGPGPRGYTGEPREDEAVEHCGVCTRRHYELTVDPLEIGLVFSDIGGAQVPSPPRLQKTLPGTNILF